MSSFRSYSKPSVEYGPFDGVLLIDKPAGPTSHDVVNTIRRTFRIDKVGHGGTLDPAATGLLVILLGRGTKLSDHIMGADKVYDGEIRLGTVTDSQDMDGETIAENPFSEITREQVEEAMGKMCGDIFQTPPMVSAVKIDGVPLYKLARKGQEVERKARLVHIYRFQMSEWNPPLVAVNVACTKGTYIRTLAHDLGQSLGCGACLQSLRRVASGNFNVADAIGFEAALSGSKEELASRVIPYIQVLKT